MRKLLLPLILWALSRTASFAFDPASLEPHPRLLLTAGEETIVRDAVEAWPEIRKMHEKVMLWADAALSEPPVVREMIGKRMLQTSRVALKRIFALSYAFRLTGEERYAGRAEQEMLSVSAFTDWNPKHYLDIGEMTMAVAIGYDWLYGYLSEETRTAVKEAVFEKAFAPLDNRRHAWFYNAESNWNSVCNAGIVYGALALYETDPGTCGRIIDRSLESNPKAMGAYAPAGGYPEGYMYWGYGSSFEIALIAALESACGTDFGLTEYPGFLESGRFMQAMLTPRGGCYNFSDCWYRSNCSMVLAWTAARTGNPSLLYSDLKILREYPDPEFIEDRLLPMAVIFVSKLGLDNVTVPDWHFWFNRGTTPVFTYRSGWDSPDDVYFGIKGGSPSDPHAHMDGGSFIYEADGVRWAADLGMQHYFSLEKFGLNIWDMSQDGDRWKVFRYANMQHNTLSVKDSLHCANGRSEIVETFTEPGIKGATVDMTALFPQLVKVTRTALLDRRDNLTVTDEITVGDTPRTIVWMMNTYAEPEIISPRTVRLTSPDKKEMTMRFKATSDFVLGISSNDPPAEYDAPNDSTVRVSLTMRLKPNSKERIIVSLKR